MIKANPLLIDSDFTKLLAFIIVSSELLPGYLDLEMFISE
jgi:hypothetical protein